MRVHLKHILIGLWSIGGLASAQAQNCDANSKSCALQHNKTTLTDSLLNLSNCNTAILEEVLEPALYPIVPKESSLPLSPGNAKFASGKARFAPVSLLRGACRFHSPAARSLPELQKTADLLQRAATVGLLPAQKSTAALFEGLTHCRAAGTLKRDVDQIRPDTLTEMKDLKKMQNESRDVFCLHRTMAKEAFSEINWVGFGLDYQKAGKGRSLDEHLKEMASCGRDLLHSAYDSVCGEVTALDEASIKELATEAANSILPNYVTALTDDGEGQKPQASIPPFTAMMARKLEMTRISLAQGGRNFEELSKRAQILEAAYEQVLALYGSMDGQDILVPSQGGFVGQVHDLQQSYLHTISKVQSLLELTDRWVKGLYTDSSKKDLRKDLLDRQAQLNAQMEFISLQGQGLLTDLTTITERIESMAKHKGDQNSRTLKSMCALYFCEIRGRNTKLFNDTCSMVVTTNVRVYDVNPLCDHPTKPSGNGMLDLGEGGRRHVSEICRAIGFNAPVLTGDVHKAVNACINDNLDPASLGGL